jgi:hypothetical protein
MERIHFFTGKTDIQFGHNGEPAFHGMNFSQSFMKFKQTLMHMFYLFISGVRKSWFTLNMHNSTYILRSSTEGYSCRTN